MSNSDNYVKVVVTRKVPGGYSKDGFDELEQHIHGIWFFDSTHPLDRHSVIRHAKRQAKAVKGDVVAWQPVPGYDKLSVTGLDSRIGLL